MEWITDKSNQWKDSPLAFLQQGKWKQVLGAGVKGTVEFPATSNLKGLVIS